jgi:hypothetical protein
MALVIARAHSADELSMMMCLPLSKFTAYESSTVPPTDVRGELSQFVTGQIHPLLDTATLMLFHECTANEASPSFVEMFAPDTGFPFQCNANSPTELRLTNIKLL